MNHHLVHPRWEVAKGATMVSLGSFSGCPKYSYPQSLSRPLRLSFLAHLWVSGSTIPRTCLSQQLCEAAHCFNLCLALVHLCPLLSVLPQHWGSSALGYSLPSQFPGFKSYHSRSQTLSWAVILPSGPTHEIWSATSATFLHTLPSGQVIVLNPNPFRSEGKREYTLQWARRDDLGTFPQYTVLYTKP